MCDCNPETEQTINYKRLLRHAVSAAKEWEIIQSASPHPSVLGPFGRAMASLAMVVKQLHAIEIAKDK